MRVLNRLDLAGDVREVVFPFGSNVRRRVRSDDLAGQVIRLNVGRDDLQYVVARGDGTESHHEAYELVPAIDEQGRSA